MRSPFTREAKRLHEAGYSVVPLATKDKRPIQEDWSKYCSEPMSLEIVNKYRKKDQYNVGVALGEASGIIALDYDHDIDEIHQKIQNLVPESPVVKVGGKGFTAFYRYNGEKNRSWKLDGEAVVELLSSGRQTVVPPSIHPNGNEYEYSSFDGLSDIDPEDLPYLPDTFIQDVDKIMGVEDDHDEHLDMSLEQVAEALTYVCPDDYDAWVKVGMAIKSAYPGDDGFEVWDEWSQRSDKYESKGMKSKWKSFKRNGVSLGSIVYLAMQSGYEPGFSSDELRKDSMQYFISLDRVEDEIDDWQKKGKYPGVGSGVAQLDDYLKFRKGELTVVVGYGNVGKSEFVDSIAVGLMESEAGWKVGFCSMEKLQSSHYDNLIHKRARKPRDEMSVSEYRDAKTFIRDHTIMADYAKMSFSFDSLIDQFERLLKFHEVDCVVIDPYNYLNSKYRVGNINEHANHVLKTLSNFAKAQNVHVILVAHPTKPDRTFGRLPKLTKYSTSGGADFVNIPDNIILVERSGKVVDITVDKVRDQEIDKLGTLEMNFNKDTKTYSAHDSYLDEDDF